MTMKSVRSVSIKFSDGTTRDIICEPFNTAHDVEGFYKEESLPGDLLDHSIYIVNGKFRDTPKIGFD